MMIIEGLLNFFFLLSPTFQSIKYAPSENIEKELCWRRRELHNKHKTFELITIMYADSLILRDLLLSI